MTRMVIRAPSIEADKDIRTRKLHVVMRDVQVSKVSEMWGGDPIDAPNGIVVSFDFEFGAEIALAFLQALESVGVRVPSAAGEIRRLEHHLHDLRQLVFKDEAK